MGAPTFRAVFLSSTVNSWFVLLCRFCRGSFGGVLSAQTLSTACLQGHLVDPGGWSRRGFTR